MRIADLELTRYVARWAPTTSHVLCSSDVAAWSVDELLALASEEERAAWGGLRLGYGDSAGGAALREGVARLHRDVAPDEVAGFAGVGEAIFTMVNLLLEPGDHAIAVAPGYAGLHEVARAAGADLTLLPLDHGDGWAFPVDLLARSLRRGTRLVILNPPHNPTGSLPDDATFRRVLELADDAGATVLCDESHRLLEHDPRDLLPPAVEVSSRAVSLAGLSKPFGLAGLRVGWAVTRDRDLLARATAYRDYLSGCVAAPSEHLATIALRAGDEILARSRRVLAANLAQVEGLLARRADLFSWTPPRGGSTGFVRLDPAVDVDGFAERLRVEAGVLVLPGRVYGDRANHFRLGFGGPVTDALARIERFAAAWPPTAAGAR
jgi:aspartate/methionine/tyrosine aminotransferase